MLVCCYGSYFYIFSLQEYIIQELCIYIMNIFHNLCHVIIHVYWWLASLVERFVLSGGVVFFRVGRNPCSLGTDTVTLASVAISS
jgi:hypothetical protein